MRKLYVLILGLAFFFLFYSTTVAQTSINWVQLGQISFELGKSEEGGYTFPYPQFPQNIQNLDGKDVIIKGYVIPMDVEGTSYAISAYPNSSCFFCGAAGQESVMRMELKDHRIRYGVDEYRTFKGKLKLNQLPNDLLYILTEAVEVK